MTRATKKYRNNLFLLVFMHLLLFTYPTVNKAIHTHRHENRERTVVPSGLTSFSLPEQHCPVCDFEFFSFVATQPSQAFVRLADHPVYQSPAPTESFASLFRYFLLRAPPVSSSIRILCTI